MAKLEVQIGADKTDLEKKIKEAEFDLKQLSKVKLDQIKLGLDTTAITANIKDVKKSLADLRTVTKDTGQSFAGMSKPVANGGNALMQFSRIAQDAPYGIIGIGNNLTATAEAFSYLKNQTGSTGGALKALASSLMGSGGILLGVSLVTTAFTLFSQSGLTMKDVVGKITGEFDALGNSFKTISEEAKKSAAEQISSLKGLIAIAQDETQSKKRRLEIVDQIQKQYPNYFGNLSTEKIMYGNLTGVVNELTQALVNKAIAEKFAGTTADSTVKLWQANAKLVKGKEELLKAEKAYTEAGSDPSKAQSMQFYSSEVQRASERVKEARTEVLKFNAEVKRGQNIIDLASKKASGVIATPLSKSKEVKIKAIKQDREIIVNPKITLQNGTDDENDRLLAMFRDQLSADLTKLKTVPIPLNIPLAPSFDNVSFDKMIGKLSELDIEANKIIETSIASTFGRLGDVIGESIASGGDVLRAAGGALLSGVGGLLSDMGSLLIKMGTAAVLAGTVTKLFGTVTGVGAGLAAIGGGIILKGIGSGISKGGQKASEGSSRNSVQGGNSYSSPSSSTGSGGGSGFSGGTVVFEISGQSLIGVLSNSLDKNRRLGGTIVI